MHPGEVKTQENVLSEFETGRATDGAERLAQAAGKGSENAIREILSEGVHPDTLTRSGTFALYEACEHGQENTVQVLLEANCNVNNEDRIGHTALYPAVWHGNMNIVSLLLECGANPHVSDAEYSLPALAVIKGHAQVLRELIRYGCDGNRCNFHGNTAMHYAAKQGLTDSLRDLLTAGAYIDVQNTWGQTPLIASVMSYQTKAVRCLVEAGCVVNTVDSSSRTALHYATRRNEVEVINLLTNHGADCDITDADGNTPLIEAVYHGFIDVVRLLILANCNVNVAGHTFGNCSIYVPGELGSCRPLELAFHRGHRNIAEHLYQSGSLLSQEQLDMSFRLCSALRNKTLVLTQSDMAEFLEWYHSVLSNARSLLDLCRIVIRNIVGKNGQNKISQLPVPNKLKGFLNFK